MEDRTKETKAGDKRKKLLLTNNALLLYSGMGFQMAAFIGVATFAGIKLDHWLGFTKVPVFTLVLSLVGVFGSIYYFIKDFLTKK